ncbi:MAG: DUF3592 domain-containing protein [Acutalibacteraceae bacterium]
MNITKKHLIGAVGIAVGIILIIVWGALTLKNESDRKHAAQLIYCNQTCLADVVSSSSVTINQSRRHRGDTYSWIYVSYTANGVSYNNVYAGVTKRRVSGGEKILLYYDPSNPQDCTASTNGFDYYTQVYAYIFAAGVVVICIVILPSIFIRVKRKRDLQYAAHKEEMINKYRIQNLYYTDYNDDNNGQNKY